MKRKSPSQIFSQREKVLWLKSWTKPEGECWAWIGGLHSQGYGKVSTWLHKSQSAHRAMYEFSVGPIGTFYVLHTCDNRKCINPAHLWLGTHIDNIKDMLHKKRNVRHKLSDDNVLQIRRFRSYGISSQELSKAFGVSKTSIVKIINGESHAGI